MDTPKTTLVGYKIEVGSRGTMQVTEKIYRLPSGGSFYAAIDTKHTNYIVRHSTGVSEDEVQRDVVVSGSINL
jgi:hypothetical protein